MTRVVICCGTGGVGKTTTSAALGVGYALAGQRAVVLTIDPARRLADALGMALGNVPRPVPVEAPGTLHALMLDRKTTWDETIRRLAESPEAAERMLANRYYRAVSTRLTGSHEYMATEKLYDLVTSGAYDVVVVDTPPSQHAMEFFKAPGRIHRLFDRRIIGVLSERRGGLLAGATRRLIRVVGMLIGDNVMDDITEFFGLVSGMSQAFAEHTRAIDLLLRSQATSFYLVTSTATASREGALAFRALLDEEGRHFAGYAVNRVTLASDVPDRLDADIPPAWAEALKAEAARMRAFADRQAAAMRSLAGPVWPVPYVPGGVRTLDGLAELAAHLPPAVGQASRLPGSQPPD